MLIVYASKIDIENNNLGKEWVCWETSLPCFLEKYSFHLRFFQFLINPHILNYSATKPRA